MTYSKINYAIEIETLKHVASLKNLKITILKYMTSCLEYCKCSKGIINSNFSHLTFIRFFSVIVLLLNVTSLPGWTEEQHV